MARYRGKHIRIRSTQITLIELSMTQVISIGASLIPFLEHNDGNRLLMGSHMQRQTVPLLYPDRKIFSSGRELQVAADSTRVLRNLVYGRVTNINSTQIYVIDRKNNILKYVLKKYQRSNQSTCVTQRPLVSMQEKVIPGQILAGDLSTISGEFSIGKIVYAGYTSFVGYNFEDGIIINERLITDQVYTSVHLDRMEIQVSRTKLGMEKITRNLPLYDYMLLEALDLNGIIKLGTQINEGDILVGKVTPIDKKKYYSPAQRLLLAVYGEKPKDIRSTPLIAARNVAGKVIGVRIFLYGTKNPLRSEDYFKVSVYSAEQRKIQVGDKLAGKHGNKGIVTRIIESQDMPFLVDGSPIDLILNPLGVPSRMNIGQLFEGMLTLSIELLGMNILVEPLKRKYSESAMKLLIYKSLKAGARTRKWVYSETYPGKVMLRDGISGLVYDNPITLTGASFLKLIHLVEDKIHARSTGPYSLITQQPLQGRSNHGGQRIGEMEVWALEAWGAAYTLHELLTLKSDDIKGRKKIARTILNNQMLPRPSVPESVKLLSKELNALCINVSTCNFRG
jgi:DNA-directed RNA polymerase subunit beta